ncbi:MAG: DUF1194 domain-containing protein [Alphaproteobacteria bacterium]
MRLAAALRRLLAAFLLATPLPCLAAEAVDLELVIATDVSYSIDREEARLQREGVASAFVSREVIEAIRTGTHGKIAVAYIDFASTPFNVLVLDWRVIRDQATAAAFAQDLLKAPINRGQHTSISSALVMGADLINRNAFQGTRRVIDVSGDGPNNYENRVDHVRDAVLAQQIVINGLPIMNEADSWRSRYYLPDLDRYFEGCVTGGPGSFIMPATDFKDFARAIKRKLILEIAGITPPSHPRILKAQASGGGTGAGYEKGCDVGERMRYSAWGDVP